MPGLKNDVKTNTAADAGKDTGNQGNTLPKAEYIVEKWPSGFGNEASPINRGQKRTGGATVIDAPEGFGQISKGNKATTDTGKGNQAEFTVQKIPDGFAEITKHNKTTEEPSQKPGDLTLDEKIKKLQELNPEQIVEQPVTREEFEQMRKRVENMEKQLSLIIDLLQQQNKK